MKKRLLALSMAAIMVTGSLTACGDTTPATTDTGAATGGETAAESTAAASDGTVQEEVSVGDDTFTLAARTTPYDTNDVVEAATMEVPDTTGWDESMKIYAYSWNDEFGSRLDFVLNTYPELKDYVEYVNLNCSGTDGTYQEGLNAAKTSDKYPSLFAMDNDVAKYFTETDDTQNLDELGITPEMYANAYRYTIDYGTFDGHIKALSWQATPGSVVYRTDIAEEVLGTSDPAEVQEYLKDWDTFFETADKMVAAGYKMTSGPDEIKYAIWDQQTQPWVARDASGNETLQLDDAVKAYFVLSKRLADGNYTNMANMWSAGWNAGYSGSYTDPKTGETTTVDNVPFCYFGCTWSLYWCMVINETNEGMWRAVQGPVGYHWGGSYVGVGKDCPNPELAAFLVYSLCCDEDIMYDISADTKDYVNNKAAMNQILANGEGGAANITGDQNPVEAWIDSALWIDLSNSSYLDSEIKADIDKVAEAYWAGTFSYASDAVAQVESDIKAKFPQLQ